MGGPAHLFKNQPPDQPSVRTQKLAGSHVLSHQYRRCREVDCGFRQRILTELFKYLQADVLNINRPLPGICVFRRPELLAEQAGCLDYGLGCGFTAFDSCLGIFRQFDIIDDGKVSVKYSVACVVFRVVQLPFRYYGVLFRSPERV